MLVAAYASVGEGLCFLFVLALLGVSLVAWIAHWSRHGFRAFPPLSRAGRIALWVAAALAVVLLSVAFPPMRRAADWRDVWGEPIPTERALELDRSLFGYVPSYRWVGSVEVEQQHSYRCSTSIPGRGICRCESYRWVIDWLALACQFVVIGVFLLPFLMENRGESGEWIMGWVNDARKELAAGRRVQVRPSGGSMRGRIESGQLVTLAPVDPSDVRVDDVVLVEWRGNFLLHLVKERQGDQLLIGNNVGKVNGWVASSAVVGRVAAVGDATTPGADPGPPA